VSIGTDASEETGTSMFRMEEDEQERRGSSTIQVSIYQTSLPHIPEEHNVKNPHIDTSCTGTNSHNSGSS